MTRHATHHRSRPGFSLIEILVVIGIIALLASISFAVLGQMLASAKQAATEATLTKIGNLLQDQIGALYRDLDPARPGPNLRKAAGKYRQPGPYRLTSDEQTSYSFGIKDRFLNLFPQSRAEVNAIPLAKDKSVFLEWLNVHSGPDAPEDSAELLYIAMTAGKIQGAPPVDDSSFSSKEAVDTDGDGFLEFVDAWGQPLRFYRWPTRLVNPLGFVGSTIDPMAHPTGITATDMSIGLTDASDFNSAITAVQSVNPAATLFAVIGREVVEYSGVSGNSLTVVQRGAQSTDPQPHSAGVLVKLGPFTDVATLQLGFINTSVMVHDPDDPRGIIGPNLLNNPAIDGMTAPQEMERVFHTLDSYHAPLIVSAGEDGEFGLQPPYGVGTHGARDWGKLAQPDEAADADILVNPGSGPLADNVTNQTAGVNN